MPDPSIQNDQRSHWVPDYTLNRHHPFDIHPFEDMENKIDQCNAKWYTYGAFLKCYHSAIQNAIGNWLTSITIQILRNNTYMGLLLNFFWATDSKLHMWSTGNVGINERKLLITNKHVYVTSRKEWKFCTSFLWHPLRGTAPSALLQHFEKLANNNL